MNLTRFKLYFRPNKKSENAIDILITYRIMGESRYYRETINKRDLFEDFTDLLIYGDKSFTHTYSLLGKPSKSEYILVIALNPDGIVGPIDNLYKLLIKEFEYIKELLS